MHELRIQQQQLEIRGLRISQVKQKSKRQQTPTSTGEPCIISAKTQGSNAHCPRFMAQMRFLKIACILSNQKAALAIHLSHHVLTGQAPCSHLGTTCSPSSLAKWNLLLGEVDKAILRDTLSSTPYDIAVFADDSNKKGEDRHMVGVHTWSAKRNCPAGYLLADTLVASGRGADQAKADHHILKNVYGIRTVCGVVGDNASTQSGDKKGHAVALGGLFKNKTHFIGCYPHVLNIALKTAMVDGFGHRGPMASFNMCQMQYKIAYLHHQKPTYYKSLYVSLKILAKPPPLPQEFIDTRWSYIHENLKWFQKYGTACIQLGKCMLEYLPKKETHYVIWEEVVRMSANPIIATERVTLLEILDRLIMPSLRASQLPDTELGFSSGYLARKWPVQVLRDIQLAILMDVEPDFAMPLTARAMSSNLTAERAEHYQNNVVKPLTSAIVTVLQKHGVRWFKFPLAFGMGADSKCRHHFWRAYGRVTGSSAAFPCPAEFPSILASPLKEQLWAELISAATTIKCPFTLAKICYQNGLLQRQQHLLLHPSTHWFHELEILAIVAADKPGLQQWAERWPIPDEMLAEVELIAQRTSPSVPNENKEPHAWKWFATHVFALPVNNVMAERQFNLAGIHLTNSDSEMTKQATHLFVENVIHGNDATAGSSGKRTRMTGATTQQLATAMQDYASTITPERLKKAKKQLKLLRQGTSQARSLTASETYQDVLKRHRARADHDKTLARLEREGRSHGVQHNPGTRASTQDRANTRSFSPVREAGAVEPGTSG
ncbi:uncharacterized protein LOC135809422 [Sycon ciliatum]|uniref:uncharacterized protein LOC135809422 n=1 Tax=Sycon ciliatum TaxID=27933 RepID=UPI0031F5FDE4